MTDAGGRFTDSFQNSAHSLYSVLSPYFPWYICSVYFCTVLACCTVITDQSHCSSLYHIEVFVKAVSWLFDVLKACQTRFIEFVPIHFLQLWSLHQTVIFTSASFPRVLLDVYLFVMDSVSGAMVLLICAFATLRVVNQLNQLITMFPTEAKHFEMLLQSGIETDANSPITLKINYQNSLCIKSQHNGEHHSICFQS